METTVQSTPQKLAETYYTENPKLVFEINYLAKKIQTFEMPSDENAMFSIKKI